MSETANTPSPAPAKKRSIGKLIVRLFALLVILVIIGLVVLFFSANTLVRAGVIRGGKYATDQDTGLNEANLSFLGGALTLDGLNIANLKDYKEKDILRMKSCQTTLDTGTIFSHKVVVNEIAVDGLEVFVEMRGFDKNNLNDLITILQKKTPQASSPSAAPANSSSSGSTDAPGKELMIKKLNMTNTVVHLRSDFMNRDFQLPPIIMEDPTNPDGRAMKIADLMSKIMLKVSQQLLDDPNLPKEFRDSMKNVSAVVDNLRKDLDKNVKVLQANLQNLSSQPGEALKNIGNAGKDLGKDLKDQGKNLQDLGKNFQNLLPGNKPATQPK